MNRQTYLVFGDLHGRILPAFRLAMAWGREQGVPVAGLLQAGDLGYFPNPARLDRATLKHAQKDPLELGTQLIVDQNADADAVFQGPEPPPGILWFTAGNHEDFEALAALERAAGPHADSFAVDAYVQVRCIRDGRVETLPGGLRVGALWGIDGVAPRARRNAPEGARIRARSATRLACSGLDVLLTHDGPRDAIMADAGSEEIDRVIRGARPAFAFFGHYGGRGGPVAGDFGATEVYHLGDLKLQRQGSSAEEGSVGALTWEGGAGSFEYLDGAWLRTFTRHNWQSR